MLDTFKQLPGEKMSLENLAEVLQKMWDSPQDAGHPRQFRASQLNLVAYLAVGTSPEAARHCFDSAIEFARHYPCRVIFLLPSGEKTGCLNAKLFSECYLDASRAHCCIEALLLEFPESYMPFLDDQLSLWIENDLPLYAWLHHVRAEEVATLPWRFLKDSRQLVWDSSLPKPPTPDSLEKVPFDKLPRHCVDLAFTRLLPLRQSLGQVLSNLDPLLLAEKIDQVKLRSVSCRASEAAWLLHWFVHCLKACAAQGGLRWSGRFKLPEEPPAWGQLELLVLGRGEVLLRYGVDFEKGTGELKGRLGNRQLSSKVLIPPLTTFHQLAEAFFFSEDNRI